MKPGSEAEDEVSASCIKDSYLVDEEYSLMLVSGGTVPEDPEVRAAIKRCIDRARKKDQEHIIGGKRAG